MAINISALNITLDGTGTEIPVLNVTDPYEKYYLLGSGIIAIGNYAIVPTGTPINGTTFIFKYRADVDITTNSTTFSIFGQSLTQNQLNSVLDIECYYDGTSWEVEIKPSFTSAVVEATNIVANAITASAIANSSIDLGVKGIVGSLTNSRIANATIDGSAKLVALSIPDSKIASVDGAKLLNLTVDASSKLINDSVTDAKLATMDVSSIKYGDGSGNPGNLVIGNNELPIGNGTTITTIAKSSLYSSMIIGSYFVVYGDISWESGEQNINRYWIPVNCELEQINFMTYKAIAGTDDAEIEVRRNSSSFYGPATLYSAGAGANQQTSIIFSPHEAFTAGNTFNMIPTKTTAGGKAKFTALFLLT